MGGMVRNINLQWAGWSEMYYNDIKLTRQFVVCTMILILIGSVIPIQIVLTRMTTLSDDYTHVYV
jgi:hypothetical protein